MTVRLAVDIGGTFTDVALSGPGGLTTAKVLTTPRAPADGVIDGISRAVADAGVDIADVAAFIHGTTLATNALIERRGATTALVTTRGFRDSIAMAHENRFEQYDLAMRRPEPLVPRHRRYGIDERLDAEGEILRPLDEDAIEALVPRVIEDGVESIAIGFLHSYRNPVHEDRAAEILAEHLPDVHITTSSAVCPEIREYERFSTACANAYVQPLMATYLTDLDARMHALGLRCPMFLMQSGGGLGTLAEAVRFPVRLVESGPAGGAILASQIAAQADLTRALSFDMGGTTAKLCIIEKGAANTSREFEVAREYRFLSGSGLPLRIPVIEMVEIGAGGSSIAGLDELGRIAVGPESASSEPGPAAYGRGGELPTVTDADAHLGRILPDRFAGGDLLLDTEAAARALDQHLAAPSDITTDIAAVGVAEMVDENMANAGRVHAIEQGYDIEGASIIAFGGAAPLHAARVADKLGIDEVIIPVGAGVGSALGFLRAPVSHEVVRTRHGRLDHLRPDTIEQLLEEMRAEAEAIVAQAAPGTPTTATARAFMRYKGQGHEITVPVPLGPVDDTTIASLEQNFVAVYRSLYERDIPGLEVEVLSWTLTVATDAPAPATPDTVDRKGSEAPVARTRVIDQATGAEVDAAVHLRSELGSGTTVAGPALIVEDQTTTVVPPGFHVGVDQLGNLRLRRGAEQHVLAADDDTAQLLEGLRRDIMWNRLISVVEEQATTLVRSAFSTSTREAGDLSAGVFDPEGRMLAQSVTGTPGHVNSMAASVGHFLDAFPAATMRPGDVYLTNDPWKGTGHLFDLVIVTPVFRDDRMVALFACTSHVVDIGGLGFTTDSREVYHEGLYLPMIRLATDGVFDETVMAIIAANVREPIQVIGDVYSLAACNDIGARRLLDMMDEYHLDDLDGLGDHILRTSRAAMLEAIAELPHGTWSSSMTIDGIDEPIDLVATVTTDANPATDSGGLHVDFTGSGPQSSYAINVPMAYTDAYTSFGVRCIIGPRIPNNTGSLEVVTVTAPEGTILNAPHPAAVAVRHVVGQLLPDAVFGCLSQVVPDRVPAEGTSSLWNLNVSGHWRPPGAEADESYVMLSFHSGGAGARPDQDGLSATAFPSGVRNMPVEINEAISPIVFWSKEFRPDSGGVGEHRGGLGQTIVLGNRQGRPFTVSNSYERTVHPPRGRHGGGAGATGSVAMGDGTPVSATGRSEIPGDQTVVLAFPGGGGLGDPALRDPTALDADRRAGLVR